MSTKPKKNSESDSTPRRSPPTIEIPDLDHWVFPVVDSLPLLPAAHRRMLYVAGLPSWALSAVKEKGYLLTDVRTMSKEEDPQAYIDAWLQGMAEGTIEKNSEKRRTLELMAKTNGLLIRRELKITANAELAGRNLEMVLERFGTRKTLKPVSAKQLREAEKSALIPGYKETSDG